MAWTWRYDGPAGSASAEPVGAEPVGAEPVGAEPVGAEPVGAAPPAELFPSQADAETWLGENWRELLHAGVGQVTLLDGEREVYGPMSLAPAE